ncbi:hypothetical protein BO71DRAFT_417980 [Aspergillus ellipticus CBS 707.79]|uniref:HMG box domain-containing protein n=1 Tax=Aspergillus ellipticus CBS 707.79 TaxID=1448320 RepID=A0A319DFY1_9EURO|nr:hypothetical protein BO71DRAFT_417980 [Aspergillus ellipticus CBS 707.79]
MRLFSKFHTVCALAVCSILLSASFLASQHYYRRVVLTDEPPSDFQVAASFDRRLVVFGDSWSDNNAAELQGSVWTEWLCSSFSCHHENLAETAKSLSGNYIGSVVDNTELSGSLLNLYKAPLADLKAQVHNWLGAEMEAMKEMDDDAIAIRQNRTIVIVSFGVWDLWNVVGRKYDDASKSVDRSIKVIMDQLNLLADAWGKNDLKIILTLSPDVTFLPAYREQGEPQIAKHKDAIRIAEYWNGELRNSAEDWDNGTVYLFDTNSFLADQIRDRQLFAAGIEESNGLGKNEDPGWENVDDACVQNTQQWVMTSGTKQCDHPEKFLFWNDMHLGPSAHRLLAFILYRQHYQAAVVAQHPGLANPDISKIIGEQWRKLPQETKDEWKALAEEEKARHQQQYPEYRYQPRRYGRDGSLRNGSSGISHNPPGSTVCSRCGGRVMNPPVSPETPFTPRASTFTGTPTQTETITVQSNQCRAKGGARPSLIKVNVDGEPCLARQREFEENGSRSPDNKRRRLGHRVGYREGPESPYPASPFTPRSSGLDLRFQQQQIRSIRNFKDYPSPDPSLKLPPLQTTGHAPGATTPMTPFSNDGSSIEATVMTIPFLNKIKVLAKISPPLTPPYHEGPSLRRGAVIAVDGQDSVLVKTMVDFLNTTLQKEGKYHTRVFGGPEVRSRESPGDSEQMGDATVDYLNIISSWHRISDEIISFVKPSRASSEPKSVDEESTPGVSPRTITPKTADLQINSPEQSSDNCSVSTVSTEIGASTVPVALVPRYQLTTADAFACSVPIGDSYAPLDHWQWMASLWRACVGPDITVYIRECEKEELERLGGNPVEIRLQDARTIVVRRATSSPSELEEKSLKRVGFEIEDFLTQ